MLSLFYSFKIISIAMFQIFLLGLMGYILAKKNLISLENLKFITRLLIGLFLPCFIFAELIVNFNFKAYANWWIFPLISLGVTISGFLAGILFLKIDKSLSIFRKEFVSLVTFQNSGYLPLILVVFLFPQGVRERMLIYIFLFLLGFNLIIWSLGVFYLARDREGRFEPDSLFSPPVIAILVALFFVASGLGKFIPVFLIRPAKMLGNCALPLAMLVVGGNLAQINVGAKNCFKNILYLIVAKLLFLPLLFLGLIFLVRPPPAVAFLLLLQGAMPSATSLSIITRYYDIEDNIVSLGIFWTHLVSLLTVPLFLILFSALRIFIYK